MRILGVDPGTATVGYGVIDIGRAWAPHLVAAGVVVTGKNLPIARRLQEIHADLAGLLETYRPDHVAVEELFFVRNVTNGIGVAMARGVILLAAAQFGREAAGYKPMVVKQMVAGHGRADKRDVQEAVRDALALETIPRPDDAADALAIALCHMQHLEVGLVQADPA
ncbi:MAG: crossover junction endodeoxyribonuclease RuvC [Candidatus Sericytochromatia bacterium]|nr:crossover junction endodeoxyribonuclease RuvC [Candidatus Tanganyikabacteria bacterium]